MSYKISFRVVKTIKSYVVYFVTLNIEAVLYLTALAILNEILRHYCTGRIFGDEGVEITLLM